MGPLVLVLSPLPLLAALARASEPWRALERKAVGAQAPGGGPELGNTSGIRQWLSTTCRAQGQVNLDGPVSVIGFLCINAECLFEAAQCPYAEHYRARGLTMSSDPASGTEGLWIELLCWTHRHPRPLLPQPGVLLGVKLCAASTIRRCHHVISFNPFCRSNTVS